MSVAEAALQTAKPAEGEASFEIALEPVSGQLFQPYPDLLFLLFQHGCVQLRAGGISGRPGKIGPGAVVHHVGRRPFSILLLPVTGWLLDKTLRPRLISGCWLLSAGMLGLVFPPAIPFGCSFCWTALSCRPSTALLPSVSAWRLPAGTATGPSGCWALFGYACGAQAAGFAMEHIAPLSSSSCC